MSKFGEGFTRRILESGVKVTESCTYWKPILINYKFQKGNKAAESAHKPEAGEAVKVDPSNFSDFLVGRAVNQYFIQKRISETSTATIWRCYDIVNAEFYCIKLYSITACKKERSVRFFRDDTEVVTLYDKIIDEILYHCSLQSCEGVCKVKELIVDRRGDLIYFIMAYYPSQLMYYDYNNSCYCVPYLGDLNVRYLYKEEYAREILRQLIRTVQYLHKNGVIHKDIKPDNILVSNIEQQMFETYRLSDGGPQHLDSSDELMETTPYNDDCEEMIERMEGYRVSEIVSHSMDKINKSLPRDVVHAGFPYNFSNQFDFLFTMWDDSKMVVDLNSYSVGCKEYCIGVNSLSYARQTLLESQQSSQDVFAYFIKGNTSINYKLNRNFKSSRVNTNNGDSGSVGSENGRTGATDGSRMSEGSKNGATSNNTISIDIDGTIAIKSSGLKRDIRNGSTRDEIKSENELENLPRVRAVLTDFGVTSIGEEESGSLVIFDSEGTISFTSPESLKYIEGSISASAREIFSLGVTLYCMVYGSLPYSGKNSIEMLISILETPLVFHSFRSISSNLQSLLTEMLHKDYDRRIKINSILDHPWFKN